MNRVVYNKLVRDAIPNRIRESGGDYEVRVLAGDEFKNELIKKVSEEAAELQGLVDNRDELIKEMGDLLDVLDELQKEFKITNAELLIARETSYKKKGGFDKKLFLHWTSDTGYKKNSETK